MSTYYTILTNNEGYAWQPTAATNNNILTQNNITSNWKYRQYIQKNAQQIMKYNSMSAIYASGNNPYANDSGYTRPVSDLKDNYLQQEQMKMRMVAPSINTKFF